MKLSTPSGFDAVLRLDGPKRHSHFVKRVVDEERAWGLWKDGWALMEDDGGQQVFPLWPAREYAERCAVAAWAGYVPEEIELDDLLSELLPKLGERGVLAGVFPTPSGKGVTVTATELISALEAEKQNYE
jgi:hypothetical protein